MNSQGLVYSSAEGGASIPTEQTETPVLGCDVPPSGWACSRVRGHDGPCAASPAAAPRPERGPVRILCDEIGFPFDRRLEREDLFIAFVAQLVEEIGESRYLAERIGPYTGKPPSEASAGVLDVARAMVSRDLGLSRAARLGLTRTIHGRSDEINPDDPTHSCDHVVDMLSSCASAIRFGLEWPCHSRHAAEAANHVWKHVYGVSRFDGNTPSWQHEWARSKLQAAIISLLPAEDRTASSVGTSASECTHKDPDHEG
jgi:hypothetical protein